MTFPHHPANRRRAQSEGSRVATAHLRVEDEAPDVVGMLRQVETPVLRRMGLAICDLVLARVGLRDATNGSATARRSGPSQRSRSRSTNAVGARGDGRMRARTS